MKIGKKAKDAPAVVRLAGGVVQIPDGMVFPEIGEKMILTVEAQIIEVGRRLTFVDRIPQDHIMMEPVNIVPGFSDRALATSNSLFEVESEGVDGAPLVYDGQGNFFDASQQDEVES